MSDQFFIGWSGRAGPALPRSHAICARPVVALALLGVTPGAVPDGRRAPLDPTDTLGLEADLA